jgi:hypothetical protein
VIRGFGKLTFTKADWARGINHRADQAAIEQLSLSGHGRCGKDSQADTDETET